MQKSSAIETASVTGCGRSRAGDPLRQRDPGGRLPRGRFAYRELEFDVPELYLLGDARKVSNIMYAIWDAFEVANHI